MMRSKVNVKTEITLLAIAYDIKKLSSKISQNLDSVFGRVWVFVLFFRAFYHLDRFLWTIVGFILKRSCCSV